MALRPSDSPAVGGTSGITPTPDSYRSQTAVESMSLPEESQHPSGRKVAGVDGDESQKSDAQYGISRFSFARIEAYALLLCLLYSTLV